MVCHQPLVMGLRLCSHQRRSGSLSGVGLPDTLKGAERGGEDGERGTREGVKEGERRMGRGVKEGRGGGRGWRRRQEEKENGAKDGNEGKKGE